MKDCGFTAPNICNGVHVGNRNHVGITSVILKFSQWRHQNSFCGGGGHRRGKMRWRGWAKIKKIDENGWFFAIFSFWLGAESLMANAPNAPISGAISAFPESESRDNDYEKFGSFVAVEVNGLLWKSLSSCLLSTFHFPAFSEMVTIWNCQNSETYLKIWFETNRKYL